MQSFLRITQDGKVHINSTDDTHKKPRLPPDI